MLEYKQVHIYEHYTKIKKQSTIIRLMLDKQQGETIHVEESYFISVKFRNNGPNSCRVS